MIEKLIEKIEKNSLHINELAMYQDGKTEIHRFRKGDNCTNCYSVSKAFTMTALGMLWDEGRLDTEKRIVDYMKESMPFDSDPFWEKVTVAHALTHRIGFSEGFLDIDCEDVQSYPTEEYLNMVFQHPITYEPGTYYMYSDAAFYLLSRLVTAISGERLDDFLNRRLFRPLRFHEFAWSHCPLNYPMGATGLYISAGDMLKLPVLYLQNGMWEGKQLVSEEWVRKAVDHEYELHPHTTNGWIGKGGMYGQIILFNREKNSAVSWLGHVEEWERIQDLIDTLNSI